MELSKLMELNSKGLLTDEALANALNELAEEKKKENEKLENMTNEEWNRQQDVELEAKRKAANEKLIEENRRKAEENRNNINRINGQSYSDELYRKDRAFLSVITNFAGERAYSDEKINEMSRYELQDLASSIRENINPLEIAKLEKKALDKIIDEKQKKEENVSNINDEENKENIDTEDVVTEDKEESIVDDAIIEIDESDKTEDEESIVESNDVNEVDPSIFSDIAPSEEEVANSLQNDVDTNENAVSNAADKIKQPFKKRVASISKAKSALSEKLKNHSKGLKIAAALAAIAAAVALIIAAPELVGTAALVGLGAKTYSDFNKGRK